MRRTLGAGRGLGGPADLKAGAALGGLGGGDAAAVAVHGLGDQGQAKTSARAAVPRAVVIDTVEAVEHQFTVPRRNAGAIIVHPDPGRPDMRQQGVSLKSPRMARTVRPMRNVAACSA